MSPINPAASNFSSACYWSAPQSTVNPLDSPACGFAASSGAGRAAHPGFGVIPVVRKLELTINGIALRLGPAEVLPFLRTLASRVSAILQGGKCTGKAINGISAPTGQEPPADADPP